MTFSQVVPAFAALDGTLRRTDTSGVVMRSNHSTGASTVMTMADNEAIVHTGDYADYNDGTYLWGYYKGWKYTTSSIVTGWVTQYDNSNTYVTSLVNANTTVVLNTYSSESDSSYRGSAYDIPDNAWLNAYINGPWYTYSNMYYLKVFDYATGGGAVFEPSGGVYVHTNFRTTSPSNYYIDLY